MPEFRLFVDFFEAFMPVFGENRTVGRAGIRTRQGGVMQERGRRLDPNLGQLLQG